MDSVIIDGQEVRYRKAGSGPPLLLIHGLLAGSFCWKDNVPAFAPRFATLAVDLPGCSCFPAPPDLQCGMRAQAARLLKFLDQVAPGPVDVIGSSWGGAIALFLASMTDRIRSLILAAPVNPWSDFGNRRIRFFAGTIGGTVLRLALPVSRPLHGLAFRRMYGDPKRTRQDQVDDYSSVVLQPGRSRNIATILRGWESDVRALEDALGQVRAPSLLVWGTKDSAVDIRSGRALQQRLPQCECAFLPGVGHLPFQEAPKDFNLLVLDFLARRP